MKAQFANVGRGKGTMTLREPFRTKPLEQVLAEPEIGAMRLKQALGPWDIVTAATIVFLAYVGFGAVSTTAEEAKPPRRTCRWGFSALWPWPPCSTWPWPPS